MDGPARVWNLSLGDTDDGTANGTVSYWYLPEFTQSPALTFKTSASLSRENYLHASTCRSRLQSSVEVESIGLRYSLYQVMDPDQRSSDRGVVSRGFWAHFSARLVRLLLVSVSDCFWLLDRIQEIVDDAVSSYS